MKRALAVLALVPACALAVLAVSMFFYLMGPFMATDAEGVGWRWDIVWLMAAWIGGSVAVIVAAAYLAIWGLSQLEGRQS